MNTESFFVEAGTGVVISDKEAQAEQPGYGGGDLAHFWDTQEVPLVTREETR